MAPHPQHAHTIPDSVFARRVFFWSGVYGILVLAPQYFMEGRIGRDSPPALTHLEYFYGFIGLALAWQIAFLFISTDPARFRPLMLAAVVEKFSFAASTFALFAASRTPIVIVVFASIDTTLGILFLISYRRCPTALRTAEHRVTESAEVFASLLKNHDTK